MLSRLFRCTGTPKHPQHTSFAFPSFRLSSTTLHRAPLPLPPTHLPQLVFQNSILAKPSKTLRNRWFYRTFRSFFGLNFLAHDQKNFLGLRRALPAPSKPPPRAQLTCSREAQCIHIIHDTNGSVPRAHQNRKR